MQKGILMEPDAVAALILFLIQPTNPWVATVSTSNTTPRH